jgi:hypothetical protein
MVMTAPTETTIDWAITVLRAKGCVITSYMISGENVWKVSIPGTGSIEVMLSEHVVAMALGSLMKPTLQPN